MQEARQEQTLSPRMIQFYEMLQCPLQELDSIISRELSENPALEVVDRAPEPDEERPDARLANGPGARTWTADGAAESEGGADDPIAALPCPVTLQQHLGWSFRALAQTHEEERIGLRIIDDINDDGYFESGIGEIAMHLGADIIEVERVLGLVHQLEPNGVGARDLRECLQIQLHALREAGRDHVVAVRLVDECWDPFCRRQYTNCARRLRCSEQAVVDAAEFIRKQTHPYPGRQYRVPWNLSPAAPQARPEVRIDANPHDAPPPYVADVVESRRMTLRIDRIYRRLFDEIQNGAAASPDDAEHVMTCVRRARQFIRSINQRRETVRRIAQKVANEQVPFLRYGRTQLRPLTRLQIARQLGIHESTVGRAVAGKFVQLPSEEVVQFELFFDSSQPVRLALQELIDSEDKRHPKSDQELADALFEQGHEVARRTVAKYRQMLRILPAHQRKQTT